MSDRCGGDIYYEACRDIAYGSELLVWYGDRYIQFMGIPIGVVDYMDSRMVDYTSARHTWPSLSSYTEFNGHDERQKLDVSDNSETNCESLLHKRRCRLLVNLFDLSGYGHSSSALANSWFHSAACRHTTARITHTISPPLTRATNYSFPIPPSCRG